MALELWFWLSMMMFIATVIAAKMCGEAELRGWVEPNWVPYVGVSLLFVSLVGILSTVILMVLQ